MFYSRRLSREQKHFCHKRIIFYFIVLLIIFSFYFLIFEKIYAQKIYPGIFCHDIDLSGLTVNQAGIILENKAQRTESADFVFFAETKLGYKEIKLQSYLIGLNDPDLNRRLVSFDVNTTAQKSFMVGREGNFFQRISAKLISFSRSRKIPIVIEINKREIKKILKKNFTEIELPIQETRPLLLNNELILAEGRSGFKLDYLEAIERFEHNLLNFQNLPVELPVLYLKPTVSIQEAKSLMEIAKQSYQNAPYYLKHLRRQWKLKGSEIIDWAEFVKQENGQAYLSFNQQKIREYLENLAPLIEIELINAKFQLTNNRVVEFEQGRKGLELDLEKSILTVSQSILAQESEINLVVHETKPEKSIEDINDLGIKELVGQGESNFAGSPKNRRYNIKIGAQKIHGLLIAPDEEFSLVKSIGPVDKETGFLPELVIKGDRTIPEYGGGLCQIGTTAFRVALNTGLPITARTSHSYRVIYYEPAGMDATIYNPWPDLRFINDTAHHLLLQTEIQGNNLIFKLYGTSDGRQVETTDPRIFNITSPGPLKYIETDELAPGEKKKVESAHTGADAEFKNVITFSNNTKREDIWKSHYKAWPEVWLIGKEEIEEIEDPVELNQEGLEEAQTENNNTP